MKLRGHALDARGVNLLGGLVLWISRLGLLLIEEVEWWMQCFCC